MRYFPILDLQYVVLLVFLGIAALVLLYVAFGGTTYDRREEDEGKMEEYPEGIRAARHPVPPILVFVYVGFAIWAVAYVLMTGVSGPPF
jgi:uncharacterized membrane protein